MWILRKMRFCKCEFCEKCEFENVNFVKIEIFKLRYLDKMWILGPLCCPWWELYLMTMRMMMMGEIWSLLSQALIQSKGQFFFSRQGIFFPRGLTIMRHVAKMHRTNLMTLQQQGAKRFILTARTVFENSDKILTFVSLQADVNFETFADAFSLLENSYKFLPILFKL